MQKRNPQYIYNNLRLCNRHFELCYHTPSKRLTRNAVPTLNIDLYNMEQEVPPLPKSIPEDMSMEVSQNIKDPKLSGSITTSKPVVPQDKTTRQMQRNICNLKYRLKKLSQKYTTQTKKIKCARNLSLSQSQTNVGAIKSLKDDTMKKYLRQAVEYKSHGFEVDEHKIFPLYDTPHLLKGVRPHKNVI
ncbi:uncharacterized protein LOC123723075 [Papilio machaon]|uniref:uncharacterized protein LOC123723075 n=1 Tax=Papilio machaon TaxID=76193 RepID=UPI001E663251|nr:uncharacterized protein LOC123723075 [Papilio machaon]